MRVGLNGSTVEPGYATGIAATAADFRRGAALPVSVLRAPGLRALVPRVSDLPVSAGAMAAVAESLDHVAMEPVARWARAVNAPDPGLPPTAQIAERVVDRRGSGAATRTRRRTSSWTVFG